jgi:hypothetical protein
MPKGEDRNQEEGSFWVLDSLGVEGRWRERSGSMDEIWTNEKHSKGCTYMSASPILTSQPSL